MALLCEVDKGEGHRTRRFEDAHKTKIPVYLGIKIKVKVKNTRRQKSACFYFIGASGTIWGAGQPSYAYWSEGRDSPSHPTGRPVG